jgi:hypothetical protein
MLSAKKVVAVFWQHNQTLAQNPIHRRKNTPTPLLRTMLCGLENHYVENRSFIRMWHAFLAGVSNGFSLNQFSTGWFAQLLHRKSPELAVRDAICTPHLLSCHKIPCMVTERWRWQCMRFTLASKCHSCKTESYSLMNSHWIKLRKVV